MKKIKTILAAILCAVMILPIAACGNNDKAAPAETKAAGSDVNTSEKKEAKSKNTNAKSKFDPIDLDEFVFEDAYYEDIGSGNIGIYLKFRNVSDKRVDDVTFWVQAIDDNGDVVDLQNKTCSTENLDAGQAGWAQFSVLSTDGYDSMDDLMSEVKSIRVYNYQKAENVNGALQTKFREPLDTPAVIDLADIPLK